MLSPDRKDYDLLFNASTNQTYDFYVNASCLLNTSKTITYTLKNNYTVPNLSILE